MNRIPHRGDLSVYPHLTHGEDPLEVRPVTLNRQTEYLIDRARVEFVMANTGGLSRRSE